MARNTVFVDVVVDDKGTTKRMAVNAQALGDSLERTGKSARTADRNLKGAAQASANGSKNFSKMAQGITGGLVPAYATLAANVFAISAAFNFLKRAADVANLEKSQTAFAASTGIAMKSLTENLRDASDGMLGFREAASATAIGVAKGFSGKQMEDLAVGARKASAALGVGFEDAFDRLVRGASKAEPELLDELGITLRLEKATKDYSLAIGKNVKDLTAAERSQAVLIETQRQLNEQFGDAEALSNPFVKLQKTFDDIIKQVTEAILPAFQSLATFLADNAKTAAIVFGLIGISIASAIPGVQNLTEKIKNFGSGSLSSLKDSIKGWMAYREELKKTKQSIEEVREKATRKTVGIAKQLVERGSKSKIVGKLAKGEELGKRDKTQLSKALKSAEAQYKKHGEIVTGMFAGEDIKRVRHFSKSFDQMNREVFTWRQKFGNAFKSSWGVIKLTGKAIKTGIVAPFRLAAIAANAAGKAISLAMRATIVLGVITTILEGLRAMSEAPATVAKNVIKTMVGMAEGLEFGLNAIITGINALANKFSDISKPAVQTMLNLAQGLQNSLNSVISMINSMQSKLPDWVKKRLGISEGKPEKIEPFTFADDMGANLKKFLEGENENLIGQLNFTEDLEKDLINLMEEKFGVTMKQLEATEEVNNALKKRQEILKGIDEASKTGQDDLVKILKGIDTASTALQKDRKTAQGIATLEISRELEQAFDERLDPKETEQALKSILENYGEERLGRLSQELVDAIKAGNLEAVRGIELVNRKFVTETDALKDGLNNLGATLAGKTAAQQLEYLQSLEMTKEEVLRLAKELGYATDAQERFDAQFASIGGLSTYNALLAEEVEITKEVARQNHLLDVQKLKNSKLPPGLKEKMNTEIELQRRLNEQKLLEIQIQQAVQALRLKQSGEYTGDKTKEELDANLKKLTQQLQLNRENTKLLEEDLDIVSKMSTSITTNLETGMTSAFTSIIQGTSSVKEAFANMAKGILKALSDILAKQMAILLVQKLMGAFSGFNVNNPELGATDNVTYMAQQGAGFEFARYGGVFEPPAYSSAPGYSEGGVARGRDAGYPATLHGTEAVVPLPNNRSIPVDLMGATGQQNNVTVNVSVDNQGTGSTDIQQNQGQGENLGRAIAQAVQKELQFQKRPGGILSPYGVA